MTALNWLKRQLLPLIMPVYENYLSPHKRTTLIFVVKKELSEYFSHPNVNFQMLTISRHVLHIKEIISWHQAFVVVLSKYPHYWVCSTNRVPWVWKSWAQNRLPEKWVVILKHIMNNNGMVVHLSRLWVPYFLPSLDFYYIISTHYEQDVCYILFSLWKSLDNILFRSTMKQMWVTI